MNIRAAEVAAQIKADIPRVDLAIGIRVVVTWILRMTPKPIVVGDLLGHGFPHPIVEYILLLASKSPSVAVQAAGIPIVEQIDFRVGRQCREHDCGPCARLRQVPECLWYR